MVAWVAKQGWKLAIGVILILVLLFGIPGVSKVFRAAILGGAGAVVNEIKDAAGYEKKITSEKPTVVEVDAKRLMAVAVPVIMSDTMKVSNKSEGGGILSTAANAIYSSQADVPIRGVVLMHLSPKQVEGKKATKIPSQRIVRIELPQPIATKEDVWYRPLDLKNVKQGLLNRLGAGFLNNQIKVEKVYERGQPILATAAMSSSGAMTKTRKLIRDVAQAWISGLPGYEGYKVVIRWTGTDLSRGV